MSDGFDATTFSEIKLLSIDQHNSQVHPGRSPMQSPKVPPPTSPHCCVHTQEGGGRARGGRGGLSQGLYFIDYEHSEALTYTDPKTETETETQLLGMPVEPRLTEASAPGDKVMDSGQREQWQEKLPGIIIWLVSPSQAVGKADRDVYPGTAADSERRILCSI